MSRQSSKTLLLLLVATWALPADARKTPPTLKLNAREYFSMPGLDVMAFQDIYPEGHQGGVVIIQNGVRVASNGDVRLEPTPGQWSPTPAQKERKLDRERNEIATRLAYPDPEKNRKGFNPIDYPDLNLAYTVKVKAEGNAVRITVDLDRPLPAAWAGKAGFNLELYPAALFGRTWYLGGASGPFPRQANGPVRTDPDGEVQSLPLGTGPRLVVAPERDESRMVIERKGGELQLLDGRTRHNNGWFIVHAPIAAGAAAGAVELLVAPNALPGWKYAPVVHVSQVGYHPAQRKVAVLETDPADRPTGPAALVRIGEDGKREKVLSGPPRPWGEFLRYRYLQLDFSSVTREGVYVVEFGAARSEPFRIAADVWRRHVWQPTLEYFLPVQMCHMRVNENYRVWHGLCHMDDALMAPVNLNHFDGYVQGPSTLTKWKPLEHVPGLNVGGWHDAGDDDLRVESQAGEMYVLSLAWEAFAPRLDSTAIDQLRRVVDIGQPDGKPDLLQQIEHGALSVLGGYHALGRLYRGIISPTLRQYVLVGDVSTQTDNVVHGAQARGAAAGRALADGARRGRFWEPYGGAHDDRMVFTEQNPGSELAAIAGIAAASRALRAHDAALSADALRAAEELWRVQRRIDRDALGRQIQAAVELWLTTRKDDYRRFLLAHRSDIVERVGQLGWVVGRALPSLGDAQLTAEVRGALAAHVARTDEARRKNPFDVPYEPVIWGAGWDIQRWGMEQYFLHAAFPDLVDRQRFLSALDFVLGCHPGTNTASFASGVGSRSMTVGYGYNRADWSYIPGGVVSGTALIRPDFPELKEFPYLWQQAEYVLGGGATHMMFLVLAAEATLSAPPAK